ncbi:MAG TPA: hypothetical protein VHO29_15370 [Marmoricola sp.]|nr:hypothetical protein [Marmoricola sp.]
MTDNRAKDGTFVIVDPDSGSQVFTPKQGSTTGEYVPLHPTGDATKLTFTAGTNGNADKLELVRPLGSASIATTWTLKPSDIGGTTEWTVDQVNAPGTSSDVTVSSAAGSQRPVWIRESDPSAAATCTATTQTVGCRGLQISYTGTGAATRVDSVSRVIGADTQAGVSTKTLATYTYDTNGQLTSVCSPAPAAGKPALCVAYTYTTVAGRTLLSQITPPGLKPWRFSYDSIARLTTVTRQRPTGGDSVWSADYTLAVNASGLPDLSANTATQWGQTVVPTKVFAVYQPTTGTPDVTNASLYYTTTDGATTNTATYGPSGWLVDTNWYDTKGNIVRALDGTGWARVQAAAAADRNRVADEASSYTVYNTWGDDSTVGTRAVDAYGPAHTSTLKNGTTGIFRTHTHTMYDDDPNVDSSLITATHGSAGLGLTVEATTSTSDAARTTDYDSVVTKYGYEPIVAGDGNGWTLGQPTTRSVQVDANTWSTTATRFDTSGRQIESRQPGGSEDASHAGSDAHSTVTTYYTSGGSGDCGGKPAWDGLVCKVSPAGPDLSPSMPTSYTTAYNDDQEPTTVQELTGGAVARTTTTSYDALGRPTGTTKTTSGPGVTNETIATTLGYDDVTGLPITTASGGQTVTTGYDSWGRETAYNDALGSASMTSYDTAGNEATFNDGTASYTYAYDSHQNLTGVDAGSASGTFNFGYTTSGSIDTVTYPNGVVARRRYDEIGHQVGMTYSQGSTPLLAFSATETAEGRMTATSSPESSQRYTYDGLGRLTDVQDTRSAGCTTRAYGFDASSNRTTFATYGPGADGACQRTNAASVRSNTYDSAERIRNAGYTYDTLGRTLNTAQEDAGINATSALTTTYHADDMVATLSQNLRNGSGGSDAVTMSYGLDPMERVNTVTTSVNGAETKRLRYRFAGDGDAPASVDVSTNGGTSWTTTRYITVPGLGTVASSSSGATSLLLSNMHGDLVASMDASAGSTSVSSYSESDEYGNALGGTTARYSWLGSLQRSMDALGGLTLMGARVYNSQTGLFGSNDQVRGGNRTAYGYPEDPVNFSDPSGFNTRPGGDGGGPIRCKCTRYNREWMNSWVGGWSTDAAVTLKRGTAAFSDALGEIPVLNRLSRVQSIQELYRHRYVWQWRCRNGVVQTRELRGDARQYVVHLRAGFDTHYLGKSYTWYGYNAVDWTTVWSSN